MTRRQWDDRLFELVKAMIYSPWWGTSESEGRDRDLESVASGYMRFIYGARPHDPTGGA